MKKRLLGVGLSILLAAGLAGCQTEGKRDTVSACGDGIGDSRGGIWR